MLHAPDHDLGICCGAIGTQSFWVFAALQRCLNPEVIVCFSR